MSQALRKIVCLYIPVIHRGYLQFLKKYQDVEKIYLFDQDVLDTFEWLRKDIRSLQPSEVVAGLKAVLAEEGTVLPIETLTLTQLTELSNTQLKVIMPDEDITRDIAERFFSKQSVVFDTVFLRWEKKNTVQEQAVHPDRSMEFSAFDRQMMEQANTIKEQSADWWRQVGAVIIKDGEVLISAFNHHVPDQYQPLYNGDPRGNFKKGLNIDLSTAIHAEAAAVAQAAQHGQSLEGAELYVTTFPCPSCAKLVAYSGIKKIYYQDGYSVVDGEDILKERGVEIVQLAT
jgi:dCMP deaminase